MAELREPRKKPSSTHHGLPKPGLTQILGLLTAIDGAGGETDVARIAVDVRMNIVTIGPVVDAAEFLGLVKVHEGDIVLTELGSKLLRSGLRQRKEIIRSVIDQMPLFRQVTDLIRAAGRPLSRQEVTETLSEHVGTHHSDATFQALVYWGRYVERVTYDGAAELLGLRGPA